MAPGRFSLRTYQIAASKPQSSALRTAPKRHSSEPCRCCWGPLCVWMIARRTIPKPSAFVVDNTFRFRSIRRLYETQNFSLSSPRGPGVSEASANLVYACDQWEIDLVPPCRPERLRKTFSPGKPPICATETAA
jgi:hypothetical protein